MSLSKMNIDVVNAEQELKNKITVRDKEQSRLDKLTPDQRLTEIFHSEFCTINHTDGCSFHYSASRDATDRWLKKVVAFRKGLGDLLGETPSEEYLLKFIPVIKIITKGII